MVNDYWVAIIGEKMSICGSVETQQFHNLKMFLTKSRDSERALKEDTTRKKEQNGEIWHI